MNISPDYYNKIELLKQLKAKFCRLVCCCSLFLSIME